jgi:acyl carrier protein
MSEIIGVIRDALGIEAEGIVEPATTLWDLQVDSLDLLELVMTLEDKFSIHVEDSVAGNWRTVDDIIKEVEKCLTNQSS